MAGSKVGAKKAVATRKARYGEGIYSEIGKRGKKGGLRKGGFAPNDNRTKEYARQGGKASKRGKAKIPKPVDSLNAYRLEYESIEGR